MSGKHIWIGFTVENKDDDNKEYWVLSARKCLACDLIDDRTSKKVHQPKS